MNLPKLAVLDIGANSFNSTIAKLTYNSISMKVDLSWWIDVPFAFGTYSGSNVFKSITNSVTAETRLKTCIEDEGCEAPGVEILTNDDCYLLDEKYSSSITMGNGTSASNGLCKDRKSFIIENRPNLKSITIGQYVCSNLTDEIVFRNLPNLERMEFTGANSLKSSLSPLILIFSSICLVI